MPTLDALRFCGYAKAQSATPAPARARPRSAARALLAASACLAAALLLIVPLLTLEADTEVAYKVDDYYAPDCERGLIWNDSTLAIDWPVTAAEAVLSDKDRKLPRFADFVSPFRYDRAG